MGVGSLGYQKSYRQPQLPVRSAKGNPCASERHSQCPANLSSGSISTNETKSSYDESIDKSMTDKADSVDLNMKPDKFDGDENSEPEPEWFSWPASRADVIDLHGFEEEEGSNGNADGERPSSHNSPKKMGFDEFVRYNHRQQMEANVASSAYRRSGYNQPTRYPRSYNANMSSSSSGSSYYNTNSNARYRNPLHQSSSSSYNSSMSSFNHSGSEYSGHNVEVVINPFFDAWKRQNENKNQMMTIADVEHAMKQQRAGTFYPQQQHQAYGLPYGGNPAVPQFFQNAAASNPQNRMGMRQMPPRPFNYENIQQGYPTPEQLQQHTSEIMRNAIMRKQYHDGKFP